MNINYALYDDDFCTFEKIKSSRPKKPTNKMKKEIKSKKSIKEIKKMECIKPELKENKTIKTNRLKEAEKALDNISMPFNKKEFLRLSIEYQEARAEIKTGEDKMHILSFVKELKTRYEKEI